MSLETLELRCLSELQRLEANDSLTSDHRETLNSIEEEVVACQKYLDYLDTMPGGAEVNTYVTFIVARAVIFLKKQKKQLLLFYFTNLCKSRFTTTC